MTGDEQFDQECTTTYYVERNIGGEWLTVSLNFSDSAKARKYARKMKVFYTGPFRIVKEHICRKRDVLEQSA